MLSAATCGRWARCATRSFIGPMPPVDQLISTGQRARVSSMIRWNVSLLHVGEPSSLRAWMCTIVAPASYARFASSAISTGVYGMAGQCFLVVTAPVRAQEMITLSAEDTGRALPLVDGESSSTALPRREGVGLPDLDGSTAA